MRYVVCGSMILDYLLVATMTTGTLPRAATASHDGASVDVANNAIVDVPELTETIDTKVPSPKKLPSIGS
jgi:hypothetical protein